MIATILSQPEFQLGTAFTALLAEDRPYTRISFVSAFTALRTVLRLREGMLAAANAGAAIRLTLGIDLGGTSREVLEELLRWGCEVFVYHNTISRATFHPKIYLFERESDATLFLGSNNLTDGGLYTNYEAVTRYVFNFPEDRDEYERLLLPIRLFLNPAGPTVRRLDARLIEILSVRGVLSTEIEARQSWRDRNGQPSADNIDLPPNPFSPVAVPSAPVVAERHHRYLPPERSIETPQDQVAVPNGLPHPAGILVWRKKLSKSDALRVNPGSHHVGCVRLTQARFENSPGHRIDQTIYFRGLFDSYVVGTRNRWLCRSRAYFCANENYYPRA